MDETRNEASGNPWAPKPSVHAGPACPVMAVQPAVAEALSEVALVDQRAHGVLADDLDQIGFEDALALGAPAPEGTSAFDSLLGFAIRRWCAPVLGLGRFATPQEYLARRRELGAAEVNSRLLAAAGVDTVLCDDLDYPAGQLGAGAFEQVGALGVHPVVDLERVTQDVLASGVDPGSLRFAMADELTRRLGGAVAVSSRVSSRIGLDFDPRRPRVEEVDAAARVWAARVRTGGRLELDDPVLIRAGLWNAVDHDVAIQLLLDPAAGGVSPARANPLALQGFLERTQGSAARVVLLHTYPYHRQAALLAATFEHVYCEAGLMAGRVGTQAVDVIAQTLELAPFGKVVFGSGAARLAELHCLGAQLFRRGLAEALARWEVRDGWPQSEQIRIVNLIGRQNAIRVYRLDQVGRFA